MSSPASQVINQVINFYEDAGNSSIEIFQDPNDLEIESKNQAESKKRAEEAQCPKTFTISPDQEISKNVTSFDYVLFSVKNRNATIRTYTPLMNKMLIKNQHVNQLTLIDEGTPISSSDWRSNDWYNYISNLIPGTSVTHFKLMHRAEKRFSDAQYGPDNPIDFFDNLYRAGIRELELDNGYLDLARSLPSVLHNVKKRYYDTLKSCPETCCTPGNCFCWLCCLPFMLLRMVCNNNPNCCILIEEYPNAKDFPNEKDFPEIDVFCYKEKLENRPYSLARIYGLEHQKNDMKYLENVIKFLGRFTKVSFSIFNSKGQLNSINYNGLHLHQFVCQDSNTAPLEELLMRAWIWISCLKQNTSIVNVQYCIFLIQKIMKLH